MSSLKLKIAAAFMRARAAWQKLTKSGAHATMHGDIDEANVGDPTEAYSLKG